MYDDILDRPKSFRTRVRVTHEYIIQDDVADAAALRKLILSKDYIESTLLGQPEGPAQVEIIGEIEEVPMPPLSQRAYDAAVLRRLDRGDALKPHDRERAIIAGNYYHPDLNPKGLVHTRLVDRTKAMPALPWHGWAVLAEDGGFRVHAGGDWSPTLHPSAKAAWNELDAVENGEVIWPEPEEDAA